MDITPRLSRRTVPRIPEPGDEPGLPIVASLAPVVAAVVIWGLTRSPYALVFSLLGPVVAVGGVVDRARRRRRRRRIEGAAVRQRLVELEREIGVEAAAERERLSRIAPDPAALASVAPSLLWGSGPESIVRLGVARQPSGIELDDADRPGDDAEPVGALVSRVRTLEAPVLVDAAGGVAVVGPPVSAASVVRALVLQLAARIPPERLRIVSPPGEAWPEILPGRWVPGPPGSVVVTSAVGELRFVWTRSADEAPPGTAAVLLLAGEGAAELRTPDGVRALEPLEVVALSSVEAGEIAERLAALAVGRSASDALPDRVRLCDLLDDSRFGARRPDAGTDLAAAVGSDGVRTVQLDLLRDGPHAIVGGTTGSGKSELLVSWIVAMAAARSPDDLAFLLIDFKGGAAFGPLSPLPHVVGVITDLDPATTRRAALSLRAELRRRERALAEAGVPTIDRLPRGSLARLVVVIDEYATMVGDHPELHDVIADLAARGRSLGVHLILCTQRPGGAIRDGVLANAALRVSLRVNNRADSVAVVGTDEAAAIPIDAHGRGVVRDADDGTRRVQFALADARDIGRVAEEWAHAPRAPRPWVDPPPERVTRDAAGLDGDAIGLIDLPDEQRLAPARYRPGRDGSLLVVGTRGAGVSTALGAAVAAAGGGSVLPGSPADAWDVLRRWSTEPPRTPLVVVDDLDLMLSAADDDTRIELVAQLVALETALARRGGALAVGVRSIPPGISGLLVAVGTRLLLDLPDREQHVLAGGTGAEWRRRRSGSGLWNGAEIQVVTGCVLPDPVAVDPPTINAVVPTPLDERLRGVVTPDVDAMLARFRAAGVAAVELGESVGPAAGAALVAGTALVPDAAPPPIPVGDPDSWQADWTALEGLRRGPALVVGCSARDVRSLVRAAAVPPLDPRREEGWLLRGRRVTRVRVASAASRSPR